MMSLARSLGALAGETPGHGTWIKEIASLGFLISEYTAIAAHVGAAECGGFSAT